ncbi:MAG: hypothetical protein R3F55_17025 [Alphaproteobacteria bacterium]
MEGNGSNGASPGLAALTICESLIAALVDNGVLDSSEIDEICEAARESQLSTGLGAYAAEERAKAAELIRRIQRRSNSVRDHDPA